MHNKTLEFSVAQIPQSPKLCCRFLTHSNDTVTIRGESINDIFAKCVTLFPRGIKTKGLMFVGMNYADAKKYFCQLICLGLEYGYFQEKDFGNFDIDPDDMELQ